MFDGSTPDARRVLRNVGIACRQERAARNNKLVMACHWADNHPPETIDPTQLRMPGGERPIRPGGEGTPEIAGFCVAEFGAEMGRSVGSAERFIGEALDLRHRLPRLWARVCANEVDGSDAQYVARQTHHLGQQQAFEVDAEIADQVGRTAWAAMARNLDAKIIEVDADRIAEIAAAQQAQAGVWVGDSNEHGMKTVFVRGSAPSVIWFNAMIDRYAGVLQRRGDTRSVDERRAAAIDLMNNPLLALRVLAEDTMPTLFDTADGDRIEPDPSDDTDTETSDTETTDTGAETGDVAAELTDMGAELADAPDPSTESGHEGQRGLGCDHQPVRFPRGGQDLAAARAVIDAIGRLDPAKLRPDATLYVHIAAETLQNGRGVARVEDVGPIVTDLVAAWLRDCQVRVQPVIDLGADRICTDAYEIPKRLREEMFLRRPSSVFPYSAGVGRRLDLDHSTPYRPGIPGQTRAGKLGGLVRREHRIVTHSDWQRRQPEPGTYVFRAPHGRVFLVNASGTHDLGLGQFAQHIWQTTAPERQGS